MGTRAVYEEKLRNGNLEYDPTMNIGLGAARCPRCFSPLNPNPEGQWAIAPVFHDAASVAGIGIGAMLSAIHGFNTGIPYVQNRVKGPKWLPFVVGIVPTLTENPVSATAPALLYSAASAYFGGYALPKFAQLTVTSYYAAWSASQYGISLLTRRIEDAHISGAQNEKPQ